MIKLEFFEPKHLSFLDKPAGEATDMMRNPMINWKEWAEDHVQDGSSYTAFDENNRIIACGGIVELWKGHGDVWLFATEHLHDHKFAMARIVKKAMLIIAKENNYKRLQTHVLSDWDEAVRFIEFLEFKLEGFHPCYGPGETNYYSYGRIL
tara:strand:- start:555 stop:1007 length:453 start_codon:yes stop_codon:yes gene_type:complete